MIEDWRDHAACQGCDPNLFYPERGVQVRDAIAVCKKCEVRQECLEYAIANRETHGVWGGMSERARRKLRADIGGDIGHKSPGNPWNGVSRHLPAECGTNGGYYAHRRLNTAACEPCKLAHADAEAERLQRSHSGRPVQPNQWTGYRASQAYSDLWACLKPDDAA